MSISYSMLLMMFWRINYQETGRLYLNHTAQPTSPIGNANSKKRNGEYKCSLP